jgi:hypothetical protein
MAKSKNDINKYDSPLTVGVDNEGFDGGKLPPNPADELRYGPLPQRQFPITTQRRAFSIPTRPTLHYLDGLDGAAETVTSRTTDYKEDPLLDHEPSRVEKGIDLGQDKNKYSKGPNVSRTDRGEPIRGT